MFEIRAKGQNKGKLIEGQIYLALWPDISDYIAESYISSKWLVEPIRFI